MINQTIAVLAVAGFLGVSLVHAQGTKAPADKGAKSAPAAAADATAAASAPARRAHSNVPPRGRGRPRPLGLMFLQERGWSW